MHRRAAWVWVLAVLAATLAWTAPAGAAQVSGALVVTDMTATTVSILFTAKRTCADGEQCDYYSEIVQLPDTSACPTARPDDPWWILWTGNVQNAGPTTETGTATPRGWGGATPAGPSRLCMYVYADGSYAYVGDGLIAPKPAPGGAGTGGGTGSGPGGGGASKPFDDSLPHPARCWRFAYQQDAQAALQADPALARHLDRNHDGVACEGLPKRRRYVATVALREAAIATRAALRRTYGRAFTGGTHHRARCARVTRTRVRCSVSWRRRGTWTGSVTVVGALRHNRRVVVARPHVLRPLPRAS